MWKRIFDIVWASVGVVLLFPLLFVIGLLVKNDSYGPVFFRQTRIGQFGKPFRIFKFRTMCMDAESKGAQVSTGDDPRITRIGRLLRKHKIDELPQLFNVISGEMSLVGPRPEVPKYVDAFREDYEDILTAKPGITDYASLEFKNENDLLKAAEDPERKYIDEILPVKIEYYKRYLREQSFSTDLKLIFLTLSGMIWR